jgi:hypothetical protein
MVTQIWAFLALFTLPKGLRHFEAACTKDLALMHQRFGTDAVCPSFSHPQLPPFTTT